jgi:hypothetical protein
VTIDVAEQYMRAFVHSEKPKRVARHLAHAFKTVTDGRMALNAHCYGDVVVYIDASIESLVNRIRADNQ